MHIKLDTRELLIAFVFILLCVVGVGLILYRHYTDYDLAAILQHPKLPFNIQKTRNVSSLSGLHHVFIIVEENHDWKTIYKNPNAPFVNNVLLTRGAYAKDYHNIAKNLNAIHPSEPNYIMLEAGMIAFYDHSFTTDKPPSTQNSTNSLNHLIRLLEKSGYSWKSYQEDISGINCPIVAVNNYVPKHNPFVYFQDISGITPSSSNAYCQSHIRPLSELQKDLTTGNVANYTFITPNLQNDMHDGTIAQADTWLSKIAPEISNSNIFKKDGALFITWDEGSEGNDENNPIGMIIQSPYVKKGYSNTISYSHASLLKTIEEIFHLSPLLGLASDTKTADLSDFFLMNK